jgi:hypothetical protein
MYAIEKQLLDPKISKIKILRIHSQVLKNTINTSNSQVLNLEPFSQILQNLPFI